VKSIANDWLVCKNDAAIHSRSPFGSSTLLHNQKHNAMKQFFLPASNAIKSPPFFTPLIVLVLSFFYFVTPANGQLIYGLSGNNLISFNANLPTILESNNSISGVAAGQVLAGLDFRPATGELYALGYAAATGMAQLYTINTATATATAVGAMSMLGMNLGRIGFDFNPTVDRIRVTGSNGGNFRLHPVTGALVATDGSLSFAAGDANAGATAAIGAVAYTNSYIGATATTLYNYDVALNVLTTQIPPNDGVLNTIGSTGIMVNAAAPSVDMDIYFDAQSSTNMAFLSANVAGLLNILYTINLSNGTTTSVGLIGGGIAVSNIAVFIDRTVPAEVTGQLVFGLTSNNNLISFDSDAPGILRSATAISGVAMGQVLAGLDFRPATDELYALGYAAATGMAQLYTINTATATATAVGAMSMLGMNLGRIGFDFNPTVDRIRVTGSNGGNFRLHPVTGALVATDGSLVFAAGDANAGATAAIGAVAYTNSFNGATSTTLYNYDNILNVITTQIPPNDGILNTIGLSGIILNPADPSVDMDIYYDLNTSTNLAYLCANPGITNNNNFYTLSLATGMVSSVGRIGNGIAVSNIAVLIDSVLISSTQDVALSPVGMNAFPNPARDVVNFSFELDQAAEVRLIATDATGRRVAVIFNGHVPGGPFVTEWNLENNIPGGVYFVHLFTGNALRSSTKVVVAPR
jgi:trimeric autotransporter adhesin